jgi:hypothetical protein
MPSDQFRAQMHRMLSDPTVPDDQIRAFVLAQNRKPGGAGIDPALQWRAQHPGQGGQIEVMDSGGNVTAAPQTGGADSLVRSLANGATWGWADKAAAGVESVLPIQNVAGAKSIWDGGSLSDDYHHNLALEQATTAADAQAHPYLNTGGTVAGAIFSPVNKVLGPLKIAEGAPLAARVAAKAVPDLAFGGSYGAGQSNADTWGGEAKDALESGGLAAVGGMGGRLLATAAGKVLNPVVDAAKQRLIDAGVTLTPGQAVGGAAKWLEDHATSFGPVGWAINAARDRGVTQFGGAGAVNEALAPLGEKVPEDTPANQALSAGQDVFGRVYAQAHKGVNFDPDVGDFRQGLSDLRTRISTPGLDSLPPELVRKFNGVVKNTLLPRVDPQTGMMDGPTLQRTLSSIKTASRKAQASADSNMRDYGKALDDLVTLTNNAAGQDPLSDPDSVALLKRANAAYANFRVVQNAAARPGAEPGVATPSQLLNASRGSDRTPGKMRFNTGNALMQDYAQAGKDVLPSSVGDSGTAGRLMVARILGGGGLGYGSYEAEDHGHPYIAGALGAGALATGAYSKGGTKIMQNALLARPSVSRVVGKQLNALAPKLGLPVASGALALQSSTVDR